ncbi:MAG: hypothetical protein KAT58_02375, partial [candidate division Zixibacteria bacterium]|nr:hypothetical protein [candidate division Zixibacteria bacterium]
MSRTHRILLIATITIAILALSYSAAGVSLPQERLERWQQRSLNHKSYQGLPSVSPQMQHHFKSTSLNFSDIKVYDDGSSSTFAQRYPDIASFADNSVIAVWEDDRNGDWDIYAQLFDPQGNPSGGNLRLIHDDAFSSQRQPRVAVNGAGNLVVVWAEEESACLYATTFDGNLSAYVERVIMNDSAATNAVNLPAVAAFSGGGFIVVWEDARNGANIYGQLLSSTGALQGSNFQVNENVISTFRLAPAVTCNSSGFAVTWEDARDGETDVYLRLFDSSGNPISGDIKPADPLYETAYQFSAQLAYVTAAGYLVAWISDREGGQSIFAQLVSTSGTLIGSNYQLNAADSNICWNLCTRSSSDGGAACAWLNLDSSAEIVFQRIGADGSLVNFNKQMVDVSAKGERSAPAVTIFTSGGHLVWDDRRNYHQDIYGQRLDNQYEKSGTNLLHNNDIVGSQQYAPDLAALRNDRMVVVWQETQNDEGDIYLQLMDTGGNRIGAAWKVNKDLYRWRQAQPACAASPVSGRITVVWEDCRNEDGFAGQNIFAQRFEDNGGQVGLNFLVNDDGTTLPKSDPDVAVADNGDYAIVWIDQRNSKKEIYLQRYNNQGNTLGANQQVSNLAAASENMAPHISTTGDGAFVISWIAVIGSRQVNYFQRFAANGNTAGGNTALAVDTASVNILAADIFRHRSRGDFYIAYVDSQIGGSAVKLHRYDENGNLIGPEWTVSQQPNLHFCDLRLTGDVGDALLVCWTDLRTGVPRGWLQFVRFDGFLMGNNWRISTAAADAREQQPVAVMKGGYYFCAWIDNRNAGFGFDLFANADLYTSTAVDDIEIALPHDFQLEQNYPNPFNPTTIISYSLDRAKPVSLVIYNILGEKVTILISDFQPA